MNNERSKNRNRGFLYILIFFGCLGFISLAITFFIYRYNFNGKYSGDHQIWAQFGDFFGGTLGPLLAFFALIAILFTVYLQLKTLSITQEELKSSNESLKLQKFETGFFRLLSLHNDIVNDIDLHKYQNFSDGSMVQEVSKGRDCFKKFFERFEKSYSKRDKEKEEKERITESYKDFYLSNQHNVGHYFRQLYHLIKYIDNEQYIRDKYRYTSIVRSHLSSHELALLFYNCLSSYGEKFYNYVNKYSLLKNIDESVFKEVSFEEHKKFFKKSAFGETE